MIKSGRELISEIRLHINEVDINQVNGREAENTVLIDIREPNEVSCGTIPGSVFLPRGVLETKLHEIPAVKALEQPLEALADMDIFLFCRSGARSVLAAESMQRLGYTRVYSMAGGFEAWKEAGLSIN